MIVTIVKRGCTKRPINHLIRLFEVLRTRFDSFEIQKFYTKRKPKKYFWHFQTETCFLWSKEKEEKRFNPTQSINALVGLRGDGWNSGCWDWSTRGSSSSTHLIMSHFVRLMSMPKVFIQPSLASSSSSSSSSLCPVRLIDLRQRRFLEGCKICSGSDMI